MIILAIISIILGLGLGAFSVLVGNVIDDNPALLDRGQRKRWKWIHRVLLAVTVVWLVGLGLWLGYQ